MRLCVRLIAIVDDSLIVALSPGSDFYNGINDRHAVLNRSAAELFLRRWDAILDGRVIQIDYQLRQGDVLNTMSLNGEWYVRLRCDLA